MTAANPDDGLYLLSQPPPLQWLPSTRRVCVSTCTHKVASTSPPLRPVPGFDLEAELLQCAAMDNPGSDLVVNNNGVGGPAATPRRFFGQMSPPNHPFSSVL